MTHVALLTLAALVAQDDTAEQFYKFAVGTTWSYKALEDAEESMQIVTVKEHDGAKVLVEWKEIKKGEEDDLKLMIWEVQKGVLVWAQRQQDDETVKDDPVFFLYKLGTKKGDSWSGATREFPGATMSHEGAEEIKVAAGTYKDAVHIKLLTPQKNDMGEEEKLEGHIWLAPRVGIIQMKLTFGKEVMSLELTEFKAAK